MQDKANINDEDQTDNLANEGPQEVDLRDLGEQGESETITCPACGAEIYEQAQQCPFCGEYIVQSTAMSTPGGWKWLVIALAALGLVVLLMRC